MEEFVTLKVGGCLYQTTLTTLRNRPDTMLAKMFNGVFPSRTDGEGNYFIDGDSVMFRHILTFLRRSCLCLPEDFKEWDLLKAEADFFQIRDLIIAADILYEERQERKKRQVEEMEFLHIVTKRATFDSHLVTSYIGPFKLFKEIEPLWSYFQQFYYDEYVHLSTEEAIEEILEYTDRREIEDDRVPHQQNINRLDPLATFQIITQYGFTLISTSTLDSTEKHNEIQKHLFGRTVQK